LLERLVALSGQFRIRLSSIEATEVTRELIAVMAAHPQRICPHLHISMQSGSDDVLRRMRRRWGRQRFLDRCRLVSESLDAPALTTDVIVGFPSETEREFADTLAACETAGFSKIHIFPFSPRRGTPAAQMPNQVPPEVKSERTRQLAELESLLRERYFASLQGRVLDVLVESPAEDRQRVRGTSCRYAPVELPASRASIGQMIRVEAGQVADGVIQAL
jgi:threonylcarbamoyladenosine tRNA methylthiotransferase MtaB